MPRKHKRSHRCAVCRVDDGYVEWCENMELYLCARHYYLANHVGVLMEETPTRCPKCESQVLELDLLSGNEQVDEDAMVACKMSDEQIQEAHWALDGEAARFRYVYSECECLNCGYGFSYDKRWYWSEQDGNYTADRAPLTPAEKIALENAQQEAAGQMRLLP